MPQDDQSNYIQLGRLVQSSRTLLQPRRSFTSGSGVLTRSAAQ